MTWILDTLGEDRLERAKEQAGLRRLVSALDVEPVDLGDEDELRAVGSALELGVFDLLADGSQGQRLRSASAEAFQVLSGLQEPSDPLAAGEWLLRASCIAVLGDRGADARRRLLTDGIPDLPVEDSDWGKRVWAMTLDIWLRLIRKQGWEDLDRVQENISRLRQDQRELEPAFLAVVEKTGDRQPAWQLMAEYHLARAAEILGAFTGQGSGADGRFDIAQQLEAQFDRALGACEQGRLLELELLVRLLSHTAPILVDNSIWTVSRAVNSRVTKFVQDVVSRSRRRPIFEMLPPQRRTLREEGILGSGHRSVVVSLPTSSGKTLIAQFRMLQALNQFEAEHGWIAYMVPTRALVKQIMVRLRRDFQPLGVPVESVSPALEIDGVEGAMLTARDPAQQFRVLVTTPEKLDLMIRSGWEQKIGRPLTLCVVDEAHNLASPNRGIKLELLLATINRECRHAQFLLLTPFIRNAEEIARWLAPQSHKNVELALDWVPNDRVILLAEPEKRKGRGAFKVRLSALHTSEETLSIPGDLELRESRPLGLSWSKAKKQGALAAATAQQMRHRGTVVILAAQPRHAWSLANQFRAAERRGEASAEIEATQQFLAHELGDDYPLIDLLDYGVGVHHAGMSDETRALVEWLTEGNHLDVVVATTTIAQGINFPLSGVVMASHQYPYGEDMPPEDFWNLAGRAGRVDQGDLGIVALAAGTPEKRGKLEEFVARNVGALNSALVAMVQEAQKLGHLTSLEKLSHRPQWSAFLQYLAHTYRQIGDHDEFAMQVELVLRGTLGFEELRRSHPALAKQLVTGVRRYGGRLVDKPLGLVDSTGFSMETVLNTLRRLSRDRITEAVWTPELFEGPRPHLRKMMGILLEVPELRENLRDVIQEEAPSGETLARVVCDWVQGRSLSEIASEYFEVTTRSGEPDTTAAMTKCCQRLFGRLTQTASWGLAALQTMTFREDFDKLTEDEQRTLRNLPARVYYGVNSDKALGYRLIGVPRTAAGPLAETLDLPANTPLPAMRDTLRDRGDGPWRSALGEIGSIYRKVWSVVEGEMQPGSG